MQDLIRLSTEFLFNHLNEADATPAEKKYRYEHSLRVANIGRELAKKEEANSKVVALGTILHDVGKFDTEIGNDHGRVSAKVAEKFLKKLDLSEKEINDICYTIAVHVDGKAGYEYDHILEAGIVSDADNIDRFGAYRIHYMMSDILAQSDSLSEQKKLVLTRIKRLKEYHAKGVLETKAGNDWFRAQLELGISFFENYLDQINQSVIPK